MLHFYLKGLTMNSNHPAGSRLSSTKLVEGLRDRARRIRPDDAGSAHWIDLAADRIEQLEHAAKASTSGVNRRTRRVLKSKRSSSALTPAQINGYRPNVKPSTLRGGYGSGR